MGMGPIGLAVALFARAAGANIVVVDLDQQRLRFASEVMQLGVAIQGGEGMGERLKARFGQLPSCIIDATGNRHSMNGCFEIVEHGGRVIFVGLFIGDLQFSDPNFHRRELTLYASRAALSTTFSKVIQMIDSGAIESLPMITHRLQFNQLDRQFPELSAKQGLIKAIIDYQ